MKYKLRYADCNTNDFKLNTSGLQVHQTYLACCCATNLRHLSISGASLLARSPTFFTKEAVDFLEVGAVALPSGEI